MAMKKSKKLEGQPRRRVRRVRAGHYEVLPLVKRGTKDNASVCDIVRQGSGWQARLSAGSYAGWLHPTLKSARLYVDRHFDA